MGELGWHLCYLILLSIEGDVSVEQEAECALVRAPVLSSMPRAVLSPPKYKLCVQQDVSSNSGGAQLSCKQA